MAIAPKWSPRHIISDGPLAVWLDPSTIVGLADDDPIVTWPDSSRLGYDAIQLTSADKPAYKAATVYGNAVVDFEESDSEYLTCGYVPELEVGTGDFGWGCLVKFESNTTVIQTVWQKQTADSGGTLAAGFVMRRERSGHGTDFNEVRAQSGDSSTAANFQDADASQDTDWHIFTCNRVGSVMTVWLDGTWKAQATSNQNMNNQDYPSTGTALIIGGTSPSGTAKPLDGIMGDFMCVAGTFNKVNRQKLEGYLAHKYSTDSGSVTVDILDQLPSNHPYKVNPPSGFLGVAFGNGITHTATRCSAEVSGGIRWPCNEINSIQRR